MSTHRSRVLPALAAAAAAIFMFGGGIAYSGDAPASEWTAPARAARKANPVPADADSLAAGKKVYAANCLACHGVTGKGDGPASAALTAKPKDLGTEVVAKQPDGALFWKLTEGRTPMPSYDKTLSETQRWQAINYVRTLAAK